jgi:hypothetical protein
MIFSIIGRCDRSALHSASSDGFGWPSLPEVFGTSLLFATVSGCEMDVEVLPPTAGPWQPHTNQQYKTVTAVSSVWLISARMMQFPLHKYRRGGETPQSKLKNGIGLVLSRYAICHLVSCMVLN